MDAERRRLPRVTHAFLIRYQSPTAREWCSSSLRDLSGSGARFLSEHAFAVGSEVNVQLVLPTSQQPVALKARTAWVKLWRAGLVEVGLAFVPGDPAIQHAIDEAVAHFFRRQARG